MEPEKAVLCENMIQVPSGGFPLGSVQAFCGSGSSSMVYVKEHQYNLDIGPQDLLKVLGGRRLFCEVPGSGTRNERHWIRRHSAYDVQILNGSTGVVGIFLIDRTQPIRYLDTETNTIYRQLGWIT